MPCVRRGEQPGVALDVSCRGAARAHALRSPPEPGPLGVSSMVMRSRSTLAHRVPHATSSSISSRPPVSPRRSGSGRFLPALLAGALARADLGRRLRRHRLRVPRATVVPAGRGRRRRARGVATRRGAGPSARARLGRVASPAIASGSARCCAPARWPTQRPSCVAGHGRRPAPAPRSAWPRRASLFARVRRAARRRGRGSLPAVRRGRRARARGPLDRCFPPLALVVVGGLLVAAVRRPPARRARSTPACGSCGERPPRSSSWRSSTRMKPAMLERAIAAGRAPTLAAADGARATTSTTASPPSPR